MRYQRHKTFAVATVLAAFAASAGAQVIGRAMSAGSLPACQTTKQYGVVYDATNATTLGSGGGTAWVHVSCASGSWAIEEVAAVADLGSYLPVSGTTAAAVLVDVSGAGNDVTLSATDDVILLPGDDFRVTPTAGSAIINAVGAGEDVSLVAADDVLLTPADALTVAAGGAAAVTTTAGAITLTAGGTTQDISLISVDQVILDGEGGADELTIDAASTTVIGAFRLTGSTAPPVACAAGTAGTMYYDSDINKTCICNATNYVLMNDDSTTAGCS